MASDPIADSPGDPFQTLGLPRQFDLAAPQIEQAYLTRVALRHPDAGLDDPANDGTAELNRARQDLKDPETRATRLLALLGGATKEQDRSLPDGFLPEMMDVRERMEADGATKADEWERWGEERRAGHQRAVAELFARAESASPTPAVLKAIRIELNAWRYIERMLEQVRGGGAM